MKRNRSTYMKDYWAKNKETLAPKNAERNRQWTKENPERHRARVRKYRQEHIEEVRAKRSAYMRQQRKENPSLKMAENIRRRLNKTIRGFSHMKELGCSLRELHLYLENYFPLYPGMGWSNYGNWHVDHVVPLSSFDLTDENERALACHYTNLQPLWQFDNLSKGNKV